MCGPTAVLLPGHFVAGSADRLREQAEGAPHTRYRERHSLDCRSMTAEPLRTVLMKVRYDLHSFTDGQLSRQRLKMAFTPDWFPAVISISAYACHCHAYNCGFAGCHAHSSLARQALVMSAAKD